MKTKLFLTVMLNCCFCLPAVSQITTIGAKDCGQWVANSKSDPSMKWWLLGFMSGLSSGIEDVKNDPLQKITSTAQIFLWMDNYCAKNPLKNVSNGGNILFYELSGK